MFLIEWQYWKQQRLLLWNTMRGRIGQVIALSLYLAVLSLERLIFYPMISSVLGNNKSDHSKRHVTLNAAAPLRFIYCNDGFIKAASSTLRVGERQQPRQATLTTYLPLAKPE